MGSSINKRGIRHEIQLSAATDKYKLRIVIFLIEDVPGGLFRLFSNRSRLKRVTKIIRKGRRLSTI